MYIGTWMYESVRERMHVRLFVYLKVTNTLHTSPDHLKTR